MEEEEEWRERLALMMGAPWATAVQLSLPHHFSYVRLVLARAPLNSWVAQRRVEAGAEVGNCGQQCPASFSFIILPSPLEGPSYAELSKSAGTAHMSPEVRKDVSQTSSR